MFYFLIWVVIVFIICIYLILFTYKISYFLYAYYVLKVQPNLLSQFPSAVRQVTYLHDAFLVLPISIFLKNVKTSLKSKASESYSFTALGPFLLAF